MMYLDLTLPTPAENLACDEALLDWREEEGGEEILRIWEARQNFVVLGYANKALQEVNIEACRARGIPILRRCSGGGTVLQGPGCLNYSLILNTKVNEDLHGIRETNCHIMKRNAQALALLLQHEVAVQGFTDLTLNDLKFSGNAQRRKRDWLLFHGTFLFDFDVGLMESVLRPPSKQPDYRKKRSHTRFLTRLELSAALVKSAVQKSWGASHVLNETPRSLIERMVHQKYSNNEWNLKW